MAKAKRAAKQKGSRVTGPVLGAVGLSLSLAGGTSAANAAQAIDAPVQGAAPSHQLTLNEEEVADVSLATFYVFDKENGGVSQAGGQTVARGCRGCGGCRGCRGCRGCGGCCPWLYCGGCAC